MSRKPSILATAFVPAAPWRDTYLIVCFGFAVVNSRGRRPGWYNKAQRTENLASGIFGFGIANLSHFQYAGVYSFVMSATIKLQPLPRKRRLLTKVGWTGCVKLGSNNCV